MNTSQTIGAFLLIVVSLQASAFPARDEGKASRYLYCATVNRFWVETLRDKQPESPAIGMRKSASDYFWQAAILLSDLKFAQSHLSQVAAQVQAVVDGSDKDQGTKFKAEDLSCAQTLRDEIVPLFKAEKLVPNGQH